MTKETKVTQAQMNFAADVVEKFILADFGGNDVAGLRNGIMADSAIEDFVRTVNRLASTEAADAWSVTGGLIVKAMWAKALNAGCNAADDAEDLDQQAKGAEALLTALERIHLKGASHEQG